MEQKPFADLFVDVTKRAVKIQKKDYLPMGRYPIIDQGQEWCAGFTNEEKGLYRDVPAQIFGDHTRVIKYVDKPFYLGADGVKLLKLREGIQASPRFFYYALKSQRIPDTGYNRHFKWLKESLYHVPTLDEQTHIADVLDTLSTLITLCEKKIFLFNELVKSQFIEMFGDPVTNPKGWGIKRLGSICENLDSQRIPIKSGSRVEGIYPYYGASGIVDYVDSYIFDERLLLVSEDGANLLMRSTPIAFSVLGKIWVNNHAHVLRFDDDALQFFVECYFAMIDISKLITGSAQPKLNQQKLNEMMIPIPNKDHLDDYLLFIQQIDKSKLVLRQLLEKQKTLKAALMQEYFS